MTPMCCELCPVFEECEDYFEGPEYCCPKCPEYEDCPTRTEMEYEDFSGGGEAEDLDF